MMEIALVSVAFCGTLILGGVLRELMRRPWHAELRELARQDVNRNRFGEIRTRLMMLVVEGTVDPRAPYFDALYRPLTLLMRAPDQHEQAAAVLLDETARRSLSEVGTESADTNPFRGAPSAVGPVLLEFAHALDRLLADYSFLWRCAQWAHRLTIRKHIPLWVLTSAKQTPDYEQRYRPVRMAQRRLEREGQMLLKAA